MDFDLNALYNKDTFIGLFQEDTRAEYKFNFDERLINSFSHPQVNINIDIEKLTKVIDDILNERNSDHMQRAFIVCLCLYGKIPNRCYDSIICDFSHT